MDGKLWYMERRHFNGVGMPQIKHGDKPTDRHIDGTRNPISNVQEVTQAQVDLHGLKGLKQMFSMPDMG